MDNTKEKERKAKNQRNYIKNNPLMAQLTKERKALSVIQKRAENPEYDAEIKRKAREKKSNQRLRIRRMSGLRENELVTESELDVNIKVEPEEDISEDDVSKDDNNDDFVFQTPRSRRRSSLETTPRSSSETTPRSSSETTPSPNRQKDVGEKLRRKNREKIKRLTC